MKTFKNATVYVAGEGLKKCNLSFDEKIEKISRCADKNADVIEIGDRDYAFFYRDLTEDLQKYIGKTVKFKGLVATDKRLPAGNVVVGRHVMTCCEADIEYSGLACVVPLTLNLQTRDWIVVTAKVEYKKHYVYKGKGPVLTAIAVAKTTPPEEQLATFY